MFAGLMNRFLAMSAALLTAAAVRAAPVTIDAYAAIVNDEVITVGDVLEYIMPAEQQLQLSFTGADLQQKRAEAFTNGLQRLIDQQLILEEFKSKGGTIPDRMINDRVNEIIHDRFNDNRAEFLKALAQQRSTLDEWREGVRDRIIVNLLRRQEVGDRVRITPAQVREAYERQQARFTTPAQSKVRMIVLNGGSTDQEREAKRQEAVLIRGKALSGDSFAELARERSEDTKASSGGDWGWIDTGILVKDLQTAIAALKPGEISGVIEAGGSFYLVKLEERREARVAPFGEVRATLEDEIKQSESERLYRAWLERLGRKYVVKKFDVTYP